MIGRLINMGHIINAERTHKLHNKFLDNTRYITLFETQLVFKKHESIRTESHQLSPFCYGICHLKVRIKCKKIK